MGRKFSLDIDPRRVIIKPGASGALQLAILCLLDAGDNVLLADPGYPCNKNIAQVVDSREGSPMRPIVEIISEDDTHEVADQKIINLSEENNLYITGLVYSTQYLTPDKIKKLR